MPADAEVTESWLHDLLNKIADPALSTGVEENGENKDA